MHAVRSVMHRARSDFSDVQANLGLHTSHNYVYGVNLLNYFPVVMTQTAPAKIIFFLFLHENIIMGKLIRAALLWHLMCTHNICYCGETRKIAILFA